MSKYKKNEVGFRYPTHTRLLICSLLRIVYINRIPVYFDDGYISFGEPPNNYRVTKIEILAAYYLERRNRWENEISTYLLNLYITSIQWEIERKKQ